MQTLDSAPFSSVFAVPMDQGDLGRANFGAILGSDPGAPKWSFLTYEDKQLGAVSNRSVVPLERAGTPENGGPEASGWSWKRDPVFVFIVHWVHAVTEQLAPSTYFIRDFFSHL